MNLAPRLGLIIGACAVAVAVFISAVAWSTQREIAGAIAADGTSRLRAASERYLASLAGSEAALLALRLDQIDLFSHRLCGRERRPLSLLVGEAPHLVQVAILDATGLLRTRGRPDRAAPDLLAAMPAVAMGDHAWLDVAEPAEDPGSAPVLRTWIPADNGGGTLVTLAVSRVLAEAQERQPLTGSFVVLIHSPDGRILARSSPDGPSDQELARLLGADGGSGAYGGAWLTAVADAGAHPFRIAVVAPEPVVVAPAIELGHAVAGSLARGRDRLYTGALVVAVIMVAGAMLLAAALTRPVRRLAAAATGFGGGRFDIRVPAEGAGEIATLARAFNRMADELAQRIRDLSESTERLRLVMEGADVGLWDWDVAAGRLVINDRWASMLGLRRQDLEPAGYETWRRLIHPDDIGPAEEALRRHLDNRSPTYCMELRMRHADGRWLWVETKGRVMERGPDGSPLRAAGTHLDIDARKQAEVVLQRSREELEHLVQQRTAELSEAHQRMVGLAHRAGRAEVASGVLHNIGNALTGLVAGHHGLRRRAAGAAHRHLAAWLDLMHRHPDPAVWLTQDPKGRQTPEFLARLAAGLADERRLDLEALDALDRATDHIRHILAGQQTHATGTRLIEEADLAQLVQEAADLLSGLAADHGVALELPLGSRIWPCERHRVLQILLNLIRNGIEASARGATVRMAIAIDDGAAVLTVTDAGAGFDADAERCLFTFGWTTKPGGHGIGLHACRLEAEAMGATLSGTSPGPGRGAMFTLRLPPASASWRRGGN